MYLTTPFHYTASPDEFSEERLLQNTNLQLNPCQRVLIEQKLPKNGDTTPKNYPTGTPWTGQIERMAQK